MKRIYSTLMAFAAALLLVPMVKAQSTVPYILDSETGYAYNKYLKSPIPDENGQYTLRIETFATGTVKNPILSSDIVIVLDMSGSMRYDYATYSNYNPPSSLSEADGSKLIREVGNYNGGSNVRYCVNRALNTVFCPEQGTDYVANTCLYGMEGGEARYWKHTDNKFYRVNQTTETISGTTYYFLTVSIGGTKYYLPTSGSNLSTNRPSYRVLNSERNSEVVYTGRLYRYKTRLEEMQEAVSSFVDAIAANSRTLQSLGHDPNRIAIIQFAGLSSVKDTEVTTNPGGDDHTYIRRTLTNLTTNNAASIKSIINNLRCVGETPVDAGIRQARVHLQSSGNAMHNKFVVVFTDGEPRQNGGSSSWTFNACVKRAITDGNTIKTKTGIDGEIFTMALGPTTKSKDFLKYLSSMYLNVSVSGSGNSASYSGTRNSDTTSKFYQDDENADFSQIFADIAEYISLNSQSQVASVDLISDSFTLPQGVSTSSVKVYTAPCTGKSGDYFTFGTETLAPNRGNVTLYINYTSSTGTTHWNQETFDIDNQISIKTDATKDVVTVSKFDYAKLWCGYDNTHKTYRGYKLIFEFPIVVKDGTLGGLDVPTNEGTSGLYPVDEDGHIGTDPIIRYPIPEVTIPIRLIIQKKGLAKGESSSFTIERRKIDGSDTWQVFTSFILTGNGSTTQNPEVRLINLDPSYHYRVKETGWSWSYTKADGESYMPSTETFDPRLENPIVFTNTPKTTNVPKHAEAKSVNTMKETGSGQTTVLD